MIQYIIRRILLTIPVILGVSLLVFFLIHLIPGDPVTLMLGETAQATDVVKMRHDLGLDKPMFEQLVLFFENLLKGDLGKSLHRRTPVTSILADRFPATLELALISLATALLIAFPLGIISAVRANSPIDTASRFFALLGVSIPHFWLGPVLILLFSIRLDLLPVSGRQSWLSYILPAITLGTALSAILTRMIRSSLLEVIRAQYITTAHAKGVHPTRVILKHALRNAMIPVVTIIGLQFGSLLGGSIITETIFSWPGIGRELVMAIQGRDYPLVQGCVLLISFTYVFINLLTDLVYGLLDPRIQYQSSGISVWIRILESLRWVIRNFRNTTRAGLMRLLGLVGIIAIFIYDSGAIRQKTIGLLRWFMIEIQDLQRAMAILDASFVKWILISGVVLFPIVVGWLWRRNDLKSWRRFIRNRPALIGFFIAYSFVLIAVIGPYITPYDPIVQTLKLRLASPNFEHWFGMDDMGRDLFSRVLAGARVSIYVGVVVTFVSMISGVLIGISAGLAGGWIDELVMRFVDVLLAFPGILLAIGLVAVMGPDINNVILALCLMGWVGYARLARGQVLAVREEDYVTAARSLGATFPRLVFRHILPNISAPVIVQATLGMAGVILAEAGLSFLGLGVQPPTPSWGGILNSGVDYFREGPHMTMFPGMAIMLVVMGLNFLGDGLRDALDPKRSA